jgi:hypothetical protein
MAGANRTEREAPPNFPPPRLAPQVGSAVVLSICGGADLAVGAHWAVRRVGPGARTLSGRAEKTRRCLSRSAGLAIESFPPDARRPTPDARRPTPDARRPTPDARRPTHSGDPHRADFPNESGCFIARSLESGATSGSVATRSGRLSARHDARRPGQRTDEHKNAKGTGPKPRPFHARLVGVVTRYSL